MMLVANALLLSLLFSPVVIGCFTANWWSSFDKVGYSSCGSSTEYLNGLYRNNNQGGNDRIGLIEEAKCCSRPRPYWNQPTQCLAADWVHSFDQ